MKNYTVPSLMLIIMIGLLSFSCDQVNQSANAADAPTDSTYLKDAPATEVEVIVASRGDFDHEIVSNGKVRAAGKADLYFNQREVIRQINYRNGNRVDKGDTVAVLENFILNMKVEQAKLAFEKAQLNLYDLLVGQGYDYNNLSAVPEDIMKKAKIKSGYAGAQNDLKLASFQYSESFLVAPISGVIANLYDKENNYPTSNQPFCSVINNYQFEIQFPVMESEIYSVKSGERVAVSAYHNSSISLNGKIIEVNPVIDKNGLVHLTALIDNKNNLLYEGMNVKIFLKSPVKNKISIPKEAITVRSEKSVVFSLKDGTAHWNYVTTGPENNNSIVIEEGIQENDTIIYKGNMHLAHGTEVVVLN